MAVELGYWNIRGLGEFVRLTLHYLEVEFTDKLMVTEEDWFPTKFERGLDFPNLPYLYDGEFKMTETVPIMRYLAEKHKPEMLGGSVEERGTVLMLQNIVMDAKLKITMPCYEQDDKQVIIDIAHDKLEKIHAYLGEKKFLIGDTFTYVDIMLFETLAFVVALTEDKILEKFPQFKTYIETISELKGIKAYRASEAWINPLFNADGIAKINLKAKQ